MVRYQVVCDRAMVEVGQAGKGYAGARVERWGGRDVRQSANQ